MIRPTLCTLAALAVLLLSTLAGASPPPHYVYNTTITQDTTPGCVGLLERENTRSVLFAVENQCPDAFEIEVVECSSDDCSATPLTVPGGERDELRAAQHMDWPEVAGSADGEGTITATYGWSVGSEDGIVTVEYERIFRDSSGCGCASTDRGGPAPDDMLLIALMGLAVACRPYRLFAS